MGKKLPSAKTPARKPAFLGRKPPTQAAPTPETIAIGRRVAALRDRLSLQNKDIAARSGFSDQMVRKIVSGEVGHKWVNLIDLAHALEATPNDILGFSSASDGRLFHKLLARTISIVGAYGPLTEDHSALLAECISEALEEGATLPPGTDKDDALLAQCEGVVRLFLLRHVREHKPKNAS